MAQRVQLDAQIARKKSQRELQQELRNDRRRLLQQQRELIEEDIDELRQRYQVEAKTPLAEYNDEELESRLNEQKDKLASLRDKQIRQSEKRGRLRALLSTDPEKSARVEWTRIFEHTKLLRDEFVAASQAQELPSTYERPTRYEFLDRSSEFLDQLSGGQFIAMEFDEVDRNLHLIDNHDRAVSVVDCSPNHFPNIYLSLWLARIEAYAEDGVRLPIVMEDPLEATTDSRRLVVAEMLRDFAARGHQVILVASEQGNAQTLAGLGVPIADFSQRERTERPEPDHVEEPAPPAEVLPRERVEVPFTS